MALNHYAAILALPAAPEELRAEALRRAAYLRIRQFSEHASQDTGPLHEALAHYERLFAEFPEAAGNDLARYQMARAHALLGSRGRAADTLARLAERYPDSPLYVDAAFRAGEMYYQERALAQAAAAYRMVLERKGLADALGALAAYKLAWARLMADAPADAADVFIALLDTLLPAPATDCEQACLARLAAGEGIAGHPELGQDALRGLSLALMARGGVQALDQRGLDDQRAPVYYWTLADALRERARYHDAAATYAAFVQRYRRHRWAPLFGEAAIAAYTDGGFSAPALAARARFVERFGAGAPYWEGGAPTQSVTLALRSHLQTLATHHHAEAQALLASEPESAQAAAREATRWYRQWLELMPVGEDRFPIAMRFADALLEGGNLAEAADTYRRLAYAAPGFASADEAAMAEVQIRFSIAEAWSGDDSVAAMQRALEASRRLAGRQPMHPQRSRVLVRAAEEAYDLGDHGDAIDLAQRALQPAPDDSSLIAKATLLLADSHLVTDRFEQAESLYERTLALRAPGAFEPGDVKERLATAIYRQAEAARAKGAFRQASAHFERVGQKAAGTALEGQADYDAGAMMVKVSEWGRASALFDRFLRRHEEHALVPDAEKWLATAYEKNGQPGAAAPVYERIALRASEPMAVRREAQWQAARLYDANDDSVRAYHAYRRYVERHPAPLDSAQQARMRLAALAEATPKLPGTPLDWWRETIAVQQAPASAGTSPYSELMAARAHLHLGRYHAARAAEIVLRHPLKVHLGERQRLMREAITHFVAANDSGFDEVVTQAGYGIGAAYEDLVMALQQSERPPSLSGFQKDAYELLLEDEIYPIEEEAISAHRRNLDHLKEGLWDQWLLASAQALSELVPGRYARMERQEKVYASME